MTNPWLTIPLTDYEAHMDLPTVGQAAMLASEFEALLHSLASKTVAFIGCAGGNGFAEAIEAGVTRLVGIDINASYIARAADRYAATIPGLELHCADIQGDMPDIQAVELVYAALVFEYVDVATALRNLVRICKPDGHLATLVQLPKQGVEAVTPSPFTGLAALGTIMQLVPPEELFRSAQAQGFVRISCKTITLDSGKQFALQIFNRSGRLSAPP